MIIIVNRQNFVGYVPRAKILEILGNWYIFEITIVNRQNAVGSVPKAKILEILRNLYIFEIEAVAVQNMVGFASAGPREGLLYIGVEINPSPREGGKGVGTV